ncbi:hypothetical protein [Ochrobactrum soli]|uniref:Uncharacterized protein n=1 Tax=Ochrobactrum soli TaxID=2448455 RepID=A0A849KT04_9HYPH|nr:hypothetical protein [[Ochrobactrum] soli]NNU62877.1 hypothetical protein [[Ochrobactrum] soli]
MSNKRKIKQKLVYFEGVPVEAELAGGESGVNKEILERIKGHPVFKRKKWPLILDLMVENHFEDATVADSASLANWADVNYNTVWRLKNFLIENDYLILINRNGLSGFNPQFVLVKDHEGQLVIPKLQVRF